MSEEIDANSDYSDWEEEIHSTREWKEENDINDSIV